MKKYIFVTGGVVSSLGKGIAAASVGAWLEGAGYKVRLVKMDPYINLDPGTMSPYQHGEVFVTDDGAETDLDLGHYERFVNEKTSKSSNYTSGQIYHEVISKERQGLYLGKTVQVVPHITDQIQHYICQSTDDYDIGIIEIGGTVGDIESLPFLEAIRQLKLKLNAKDAVFVHLTLLPYIATAGEIKTKPTQHSVKELRSIGIQPDILLCRSETMVGAEQTDKIALFTNVHADQVFCMPDVKSIYQIPLYIESAGIGGRIADLLGLPQVDSELSDWRKLVSAQEKASHDLSIAMVGKYTEYADSYKSINEALLHACIRSGSKLKITHIDAEGLSAHQLDEVLGGYHAILVPGGFGVRGVEGMILACQYARENQIPFLGICLGMQVAAIEFARHVAGLKDASSTEFDPETTCPLIGLITEWADESIQGKMGGTMRLGGKTAVLEPGSKMAKIYGGPTLRERHRHRYEFNENYLKPLKEKGLSFSARCQDSGLVEAIEVQDHPWYVACQFHPEFTSTPRKGHPLFTAFVKAAWDHQNG
ncbi:CTP synthase [Gammaproteobacteria bacterium]|nr:CTP synthase [Gammaproteobacteria bacterium]